MTPSRLEQVMQDRIALLESDVRRLQARVKLNPTEALSLLWCLYDARALPERQDIPYTRRALAKRLQMDLPGLTIPEEIDAWIRTSNES